MLTVWEAIKMRRSIRKFAPDDVPDEMIKQMLEAARLAPSATNCQSWRFLVVRDKEVKKELRRICLEQRFIEEAPVVIVCFGDLEQSLQAAKKKRRKEFVDTGVAETLSGIMSSNEFWERVLSLPDAPRERLSQSVYSPQANTYIAIDHLVLMATALGLGTCWVGGFDASEINRLFGLAETLIPFIVIPVGYPAGKLPPQRPRLDLEEILLKPVAQHTGEGA